MADRRGVWQSGSVVIILLLTAAGALLVLERYGYLTARTVTEVATATNQPFVMPDFSLVDAEGSLQRLSTVRGRIVLVNFWATWCPPCLDEIASLEALYQTYKDRGLEVLAVSSDKQGAQIVLPFVTQHRLSFPVLLDPSGEVTRLYGVSSLPTTYVLDREGRLVTVAVGGQNWTYHEAQEHIVPLLNGRPSIPRDNTAEAASPSAQQTDRETRRP
jgi:peroxiredoxin